MISHQKSFGRIRVALHPEGVDRNKLCARPVSACTQSPSTRRAWIEIARAVSGVRGSWSPSTRRAWIEINLDIAFSNKCTSPSTRRAWIEMQITSKPIYLSRSPSTRRAWIEIHKRSQRRKIHLVALHPEGVDRNLLLPDDGVRDVGSPSTRRAWIEIRLADEVPAAGGRRPPPGGRG